MDTLKKTPGLSPSELYRPSDRRLSAKLVPALADRGCRVVNATNPHGRQSWFSRPEPLLSFQVAPHLSSLGWVDPVLDPLLLRKFGSAENWTRDLWICSQELWPRKHRRGRIHLTFLKYIKMKMTSATATAIVTTVKSCVFSDITPCSPSTDFMEDRTTAMRPSILQQQQKRSWRLQCNSREWDSATIGLEECLWGYRQLETTCSRAFLYKIFFRRKYLFLTVHSPLFCNS
jgi:hypothetical protein